MDLMSRLDRVLLHAEVRDEGLLDTIDHLSQGSREEQIEKMGQWLAEAANSVESFEKLKQNLELIIEGLEGDPRVEQLRAKDLEASRKLEQKQYLIEIVQNRQQQLLTIKPSEFRIPSRKTRTPQNPNDLGQSLLSNLSLI